MHTPSKRLIKRTLGLLALATAAIGVNWPALARAEALAELTLMRHQDRFRGCYEEQLRSKPELHGRVVVAFSITPEGRASELVIKSTTLRNAKVENCLLDVIREITDFPPPDSGAKVQLTYPFKFAPKSRKN